MWKKIPHDSFIVGILLGAVSLFFFYYMMTWIRMILIRLTGNGMFLIPPRVQFIVILLNIICVRFLIVKFDRENMGKGVLFSTVLISLLYFFYFFRIHNPA